MSNEKCCKNCVHFGNEGVNETGLCCKSLVRKIITYRYNCCVAHEWKLTKWTEIAPDNVDSIYDDVINRVIITDGKEYKPALDWHCGLSTMAKIGGYYYMELPELKIE